MAVRLIARMVTRIDTLRNIYLCRLINPFLIYTCDICVDISLSAIKYSFSTSHPQKHLLYVAFSKIIEGIWTVKDSFSDIKHHEPFSKRVHQCTFWKNSRMINPVIRDVWHLCPLTGYLTVRIDPLEFLKM